MPAVQGANPDSEREVIGSLILPENEIFYRHATELQFARCELGSDARTTANLQNTHARAQRQCCNDFSEAW